MKKKETVYHIGLYLLCICSICLLCGCEKSEPEDSLVQLPNDSTSSNITEPEDFIADEVMLPEEFPLNFLFSSGAGGWGTSITLNRDGFFQGIYTDSEMGIYDETYPSGTKYISEFNGQFDIEKQINDYTYSLLLRETALQQEIGTEWIENGIRYIASDPYGLEQGLNFLLYTPETPLNELSDDFLSWWPENWRRNQENLKILGCYGIYNIEMGYGFFTDQL